MHYPQLLDQHLEQLRRYKARVVGISLASCYGEFVFISTPASPLSSLRAFFSLSCYSEFMDATSTYSTWLSCCVTNQKVTGSIPAGVIGFFIDIKSFRSHYDPGIDSASNRNEYQEYFLGVKAAGA